MSIYNIPLLVSLLQRDLVPSGSVSAALEQTRKSIVVLRQTVRAAEEASRALVKSHAEGLCISQVSSAGPSPPGVEERSHQAVETLLLGLDSLTRLVSASRAPGEVDAQLRQLQQEVTPLQYLITFKDTAHAGGYEMLNVATLDSNLVRFQRAGVSVGAVGENPSRAREGGTGRCPLLDLPSGLSGDSPAARHLLPRPAISECPLIASGLTSNANFVRARRSSVYFSCCSQWKPCVCGHS